jgi:hypothetical protein
VEIEKVRL